MGLNPRRILLILFYISNVLNGKLIKKGKGQKYLSSPVCSKVDKALKCSVLNIQHRMLKNLWHNYIS
jgi:hypothetical protein